MILLLIPAVTLILIIFGFPLFHYAWLSNHASSVITGLENIPNYGANWIRLINDERFWMDALQTARFAICSVSIELIFAILIALLLNLRVKGQGFIRASTILPWALPTTIMALGWRWIFNTPYGPINQIVNLFGFENINILSNPNLAWIATVIADVWKTTPFVALIILAGLQSIPADLYEAYKLEGANSTNRFLKITLPLLQPYITLAILFRMAQAFGVFDLIQIMTGGGPAGSTESLALYAYLNSMRFLDFGYSSTIILASFLLLILSCVALMISVRTLKYVATKFSL